MLDSTQRSQLLPKTIKVKLNHPKLSHLNYCFPKTVLLSQVIRTITQDNILKLFNNYHFQYEGKTLKCCQSFVEAVEGDIKDVVDLDLVFQPYRYSTAMHHFQEVHRLIKNTQKLYSILKPTSKENRNNIEAEPQQIMKQLVPESFRGGRWSIEEVIAPNYRSQLWQPSQPQGQQLIHFIQLSGFNPPPPQVQFSGDLFYLHLKTLQNYDCHITASPLGFYQNQSKINSYNPAMHNGRSIYTNLFDLMAALSDKFTQTLERNMQLAQNSLLQRISRKNQSLLENMAIQQHRIKWLNNLEMDHQWNTRKQQTLKELQYPSQSLHDWNQQFLNLEKQAQNIKPNITAHSYLWEAQAYRQLYIPFTEAALDGARKIVQGKLQAINHMDQKRKHIYIHNKIFFSVTQDTPYDHSLQKGQDAIPSASSANIDLNNLQTLLHLQRGSMRLLHTVLINYRGYKIIGQTIIPGLLSSELSYLTQYGSIDQGKSIQSNPQFHQLLLPICKQLHLDEHVEAEQKNGNLVPIAISPQIKGIKSIGGQYYLCDIQKLSPRDLNYPGLENEACVLRHKLITQFLSDKRLDLHHFTGINVNIGTDVKFKQSSKTEQQQKILTAIAAYIKDTAIIRLINALKSKNAGDYLTDSQGVSSIFHEYGVNMRYLGFVESHQLLKDSIEVKYCLIRVILVRSLKHFFRNALRQTNNMHVSQAVSHLLNCVFARKHILAQLNESEECEDRQEVNEPVKKKKKKKNKEQERQTKLLMTEEGKVIKVDQSTYLNMKPNDIWKQINKISEARFNHHFEPTIIEFNQKGLFCLPYQKYATLRDLCLSLGLTLQRKDYSFKQTDKQGDCLPFSTKNILYFTPLSKVVTIRPSQLLLAKKQQADILFSNSNYSQALIAYEEIVEMMKQRKQGQTYLSHCLGQISRIHYMLGSIHQAISTEIQNLMFSQRSGREDSLQVIRCYSRLGLYCMGISSWQLAQWLLYKGLHLMLVSFGQAYPDVLINFANIARVHQLTKEIALASSCYVKAIELLSQVYGSKNHVNISFCYSSLASLHYEWGEFKKSVEYQTEAVNILNKVLCFQDSRLIDAGKILKVYKEIFLNSKNNTNSKAQHPHPPRDRDRKK